MAINRIEYPLNLTDQADFSAHGALIEARYRDQSAIPIQVRDGVIPQGVVLQIGGVTYKVDTDETISGTASDYVRVTPNGATATADYVADLTGVLWNAEYNGYYDSQSPARLYLFEEAIAMRNGEIATVVQRYVRQTIDGDVNAGRDIVATRDFRKAGIEGGVAGQGASATLGGAVGRLASATNGGAVGRGASSTNGAAVGWGASANDGGAFGWSASANDGGAVGSFSSSTFGGAVGSFASSEFGGAVGRDASATGGGAVGVSSSSTDGGAVGRDASATNGFSGGDGAVSGDNEANLVNLLRVKYFPGNATNADVWSYFKQYITGPGTEAAGCIATYNNSAYYTSRLNAAGNIELTGILATGNPVTTTFGNSIVEINQPITIVLAVPQ